MIVTISLVFIFTINQLLKKLNRHHLLERKILFGIMRSYFLIPRKGKNMGHVIIPIIATVTINALMIVADIID